MTPSKEYELKARLLVDLDGFRRTLAGAGWIRVFAGSMRDWRLDSDTKALERRDEVLRLRRYEAPDRPSRSVLAWKGPVRTENGFKVSRSRLDPERVVANRLGVRSRTSTAMDGSMSWSPATAGIPSCSIVKESAWRRLPIYLSSRPMLEAVVS